MGRRTVYIKNPSSGSHFRTIGGSNSGGSSGGVHAPRPPKPPTPGLPKPLAIPKLPKPPKPNYGNFQKYGEWWNKTYGWKRDYYAKKKLKMLKSIAKKLAKMSPYNGPNPALAIQAYINQLSEQQLDAMLSAQEDQAEMANMLYPKYGDPKAFIAGLLTFAGIIAGEAFASTTLAEHAAWDTQSFGGVGAQVYDKGLLFYQAGPIANPITGATMTAEQISAIQSIPTGLSQAETLGQLFTILAAP